MPAIMEVTLNTLFAGVQCVNRWNYRATGTPAVISYSFALASPFGALPSGADFAAGSIMAAIQDLMDADVQFVQLVIRDVHSFTDFYEIPFLNDKFGQFAGVSISPMAAFGFRTNRTNLSIRRGMKRFTGVSKEALGVAGTLSASATVIAEDLADKMSTVLAYTDEGNSLSFAPIVCKRLAYVVPGSDPERTAYKYYPDYETQNEHSMDAITWENYPTMRGQGSRQFGKGQ